MKISKEGIALIKKFEGIELQAYQDSVGVWTIGYGHTKGVKEGDNISLKQAEAMLEEELEVPPPPVMSCPSLIFTTVTA